MIRVLVLLLAFAVIGSAQFGSITLIPKTDDSDTGTLLFREKFANGTNYVGFKAPAALSANVIWQLPSTDGTAGQCLTTNGSKVLSFAACSIPEPIILSNSVGEKIRLFRAGTNLDYGIGVQASQYQFYVPYNTSYFSFGYGTSGSFTEQVRIGNGVVDIGAFFLQGGSNLVVVKSHLSPQADNTYDLGEQTGTIRWRDLRLGRNAYIDGNLTIAGTCTGCASLPGVDTTAILKNAVDNTKLLRFDLSGFSAGVTRILTPQNASYTIAGTNIANTFTSDQTISGAKLLFNNVLGAKVQLYQSGAGADFGFGIQSAQLQSYVAYNTDSFVWGYGTSSVFTTWLTLSSSALDIGARNLKGSSSLVTVQSHLAPQADNTYDLGDQTGTVRWRDLRLSRNAYVGGIVYPGAVIAGSGAPNGYGFYTRSQDSTKEWFAFAYDGSGTFMGSTTNDSLTIRTNNLNRTTWSASGDITHSYNMTISGNLTVSGTCTGCGAASVWTRNAGGYLYPTTTTDKLMIGGSGTPADMVEVVGGVRLSGHITYSSGGLYDIGTGATRARTGYFTNIDVSGSCTGCGGGWTRNGGGYVYPTTTTDIVVVGGSSAPSGAYKLEVQGGGINAAGSIVPGSNVSYALGSSSLLWNVAYISTLRVADRIIGSATNASGTVLIEGSMGPAANATYDLGEPTGTVQWRDLRLSGYIYVDGYAGLDSGTVTCASGQAIKSLSFHGGIVTGYVCGTP